MTERRDDAEQSAIELSPVELSAADLAGFRARLQADRSVLQAEHDAALAELDKLRETGEDGADAAFQREQQQAIASSRHTLLAQLDHALERMDDRTYGLCEHCGRSISRTRLTMLPMATLDGRCAAVPHGERE